jgi:hypothetical protein
MSKNQKMTQLESPPEKHLLKLGDPLTAFMDSGMRRRLQYQGGGRFLGAAIEGGNAAATQLLRL